MHGLHSFVLLSARVCSNTVQGADSRGAHAAVCSSGKTSSRWRVTSSHSSIPSSASPGASSLRHVRPLPPPPTPLCCAVLRCTVPYCTTIVHPQSPQLNSHVLWGGFLCHLGPSLIVDTTPQCVHAGAAALSHVHACVSTTCRAFLECHRG